MYELKILLLIVLIWIILGFLSFLIYAKSQEYTVFNRKVKGEFILFIIIGPVGLLGILYCLISWYFDKFMNSLLYKMNHKESEDKENE